MSPKPHNRSKLVRFITLPIRALGKAKDLYVRSVMDCAPRVSYGYPAAQLPILPKSHSTRSCRSSDGEDFRELVRAASARTLDIKTVDDRLFLQQNLRVRSAEGRRSDALPKSCSVGMGRIDEDSACDFEEAVEEKNDWVYSRSRSYAVTNRRSGF